MSKSRAIDRAIFKVLSRIEARDSDDQFEVEDGGKGSGNFGHKGRPGLRGGSGAGGGKAFRTTSKETESGYIGVQRAHAFKSIATHARAHSDYNEWYNSLASEQKLQIKNQYEACGTQESREEYRKRLHSIMCARPAEKWKETNKPVTGKDIMMSFKWDRQKHDYEIDAVIDAQGFNGVPKIVSKKEFDEIVKNNPNQPILFRSYVGRNADELATYDEMLEHGDFYVNCATGGAGWGQGMYCAGVYDHSKGPDGALEEMRHYRKINKQRKSTFDPRDYLQPGESYASEYNGSTGQNEFFRVRKDEAQNFSAKLPEEGQRIAFNTWGGSLTYCGIWKNGEIYDLDGTPSGRLQRSLVANMSARWAPLGEKIVPDGDINPMAGTRMMTLTPDAKIIVYDDIIPEAKKREAEQRKVLAAQYRDEVKKDLAAKLANGTLTEQQMKDDLYHDILCGNSSKEQPTDDEANKAYQAFQDYYKKLSSAPNATYTTLTPYWNMRYKMQSFLPSNRSVWSVGEKGLMRYFLQNAAYDYQRGGTSVTNSQEWQNLLAIPEIKSAFDGILQRAKARADKGYKTHWVNWNVAMKMPPKEDWSGTDRGVLAAQMGYDAINAERHGRSGSYTVVLNRTKVILSEERVNAHPNGFLG